MPPHDTYIETHLGGGNVLERKRPARSRNVGIDVDGSVIARWREVGRRLPFDLELQVTPGGGIPSPAAAMVDVT